MNVRSECALVVGRADAARRSVRRGRRTAGRATRTRHAHFERIAALQNHFDRALVRQRRRTLAAHPFDPVANLRAAHYHL